MGERACQEYREKHFSSLAWMPLVVRVRFICKTSTEVGFPTGSGPVRDNVCIFIFVYSCAMLPWDRDQAGGSLVYDSISLAWVLWIP